MKTREIRALAAGAGLALAAAASAESPPFGIQFYEAGRSPQTLAAGDYNADGVPDLAWFTLDLENDSGAVSIMPSVGDGSFEPRRSLSQDSNNFRFVFLSGDFDGDGADEVLASDAEGDDAAGAYALYRLNPAGDAVVKQAVTLTGIDTDPSIIPIPATVGDFNGDGRDDVALPNPDGTGVDLTFGFPSAFDFGQTFQTDAGATENLTAVSAADLDGDGADELLYAHEDRLAVWSQASGEIAVFELEDLLIKKIGSGEFDGEPGLDLFAGGDGGATFTIGNPLGAAPVVSNDAPALLIAGDAPISDRTVIDADLDGLIDLVTTISGPVVDPNNPIGGFGEPVGASYLWTRTPGSFVSAPFFNIPKLGFTPEAVVAADFNSDGVEDLAAANSYSAFGSGVVTVLLGQAENSFGQFTTVRPLIDDVTRVRFLDLTGDGYPDIVANGNYIPNDNGVYVGKVPNKRSPLEDTGGEPLTANGLIDLDGDGDFDHLVIDDRNDEALVSINENGVFTTQTPLPIPTEGNSFFDQLGYAPSLNGEIGAVAYAEDITVSGEPGSDDRTVVYDLVIVQYTEPAGLEIIRVEAPDAYLEPELVDVTGDGRPDIFWKSRNVEDADTFTNLLWPNDGDGNFVEDDEPFLETARFQFFRSWNDLNDDGLPDVIAERFTLTDSGQPASSEIQVLLRQPNREFTVGQTLTGPAETGVPAFGLIRSIALVDLNGDGTEDLLCSVSVSPPPSQFDSRFASALYFPRRPDGVFQRARGIAHSGAPGRLAGIDAADVDLDGDQDILYAAETISGPINNTAVLESAVIYNRTEGPKRSCPYDVDGDNRVGASDLGFLLAIWGTDVTQQDGLAIFDDDGDGVIGSGDLGPILAAWGPCPE